MWRVIPRPRAGSREHEPPCARPRGRGVPGCDLCEDATHVVFGEGAKRAEVMLVGEQPGDREDLEGRPFVGPAGRLLDDALARAGIDRDHAYVTNAVKHFKWRPRGTRRTHDKPSWSQTLACRPWLLAELKAVRPQALVLMGAMAAQALLGRPSVTCLGRHGRGD